MILTASQSGNFAPPGPVRICSFFGPLAGPIFGYDFFASSFRAFVSFRRGRFDREFPNRALDTSCLNAPPQEGQEKKFRSNYYMGGLTRVRVRPACGAEVSRKRKRGAQRIRLGSKSNTGAGEIWSNMVSQLDMI